MATSADPYVVLGVERTATVEEIHAAYRVLARAAHPDVGAADDERMAGINDAWALLRDDDRRAAYDRTSGAPSVGTGPATARAAPDFSRRAQRLFRAIIVIVAILALAVLFTVFVAGFGRVGS